MGTAGLAAEKQTFQGLAPTLLSFPGPCRTRQAQQGGAGMSRSLVLPGSPPDSEQLSRPLSALGHLQRSTLSGLGAVGVDWGTQAPNLRGVKIGTRLVWLHVHGSLCHCAAILPEALNPKLACLGPSCIFSSLISLPMSHTCLRVSESGHPKGAQLTLRRTQVGPREDRKPHKFTQQV